MYARPLTAFIDAEPTLKPLFKRLSELSYVQRIYVEAVPSALAQLGLVASIREGTLVIAAKNGAAAAKLKQLAPQIAEKVSQRLQQPVDIQVIVQVEESADTNTARKKQAMRRCHRKLTETGCGVAALGAQKRSEFGVKTTIASKKVIATCGFRLS